MVRRVVPRGTTRMVGISLYINALLLARLPLFLATKGGTAQDARGVLPHQHSRRLSPEAASCAKSPRAYLCSDGRMRSEKVLA